jgi:ankyrin repeat protein
MAIKEGHFEAAKFILEQKAGTEEGGQYGWTPLMWASLAGKIEIAKLLVQYGANVNACDKYNESCIHLAIRNLHTSMVEFLIESGAEPNRKGDEQDSPFLCAVNKGDYNTCKLLLQYTNVNDTTAVCFFKKD